MARLEHITTGVDNTATESWDQRGSVSTTTTISPLLCEASWITRQAKIHASISCIPVVENIKSDAALRLTHLPVPVFLKSFNTSFPQPTPWRLYLLPSGVTPRLHTMLLTKQSPKAFPLPDSTRTTLRGNNGTPSSHGYASPTSLQCIRDLIHFLQIFAHKVCTGILMAKHKHIQKISVE